MWRTCELGRCVPLRLQRRASAAHTQPRCSQAHTGWRGRSGVFIRSFAELCISLPSSAAKCWDVNFRRAAELAGSQALSKAAARAAAGSGAHG